MNIERGMEFTIAYSLAIASAATASLYGLMSATGAYGVVKGLGLFGVAFVGCHGPAWIVKAKKRVGWPGAVFGVLVTAVCLAATLWGGLGTNASGGAALRAERNKVTDTTREDRAELAQLMRDRAKLPAFVPTTEEAVKAARDAVSSAERVRAAECDTRRARCRERETEEQLRRTELAIVLSNRAAAVNVAKFDAAAARLRERLDVAPAPIDADPQASAFSQLTGVSVDLAIALNAFWLSMAFELGAMFTMLIAYSNPPVAPTVPATVAPSKAEIKRPVEDAQVVSPPKRSPIIAGTKMIEPPRGPVGDVKRFLLACLPRAHGEQVPLSAVYARYQRWCDEQTPKATPLSATAFAEEFRTICERVALRTRQDGSKVYCLDVKLVA